MPKKYGFKEKDLVVAHVAMAGPALELRRRPRP